MRTLRCKCGENIAWTTDGFEDCQGCSICNTTYAGHPDHHRDLQPHTWKTMYNENTGKPYKRCEKCHEVDEESYKEARSVYDEKGNIKGAKTYESPAVLYTTPLEEEDRIDEFLTFEIPPDDELDDDGKLINDPSLDELPIPKDLDEAIEILTNEQNKEFVLSYSESYSEDELLSVTHHGFGTGIRNAWGLWTGSDLAKWFNEKGIYHADDMSGIILTSFYRKALGKEIDLEGQINKYREFWKKNDPDVNKGII